MPNGMSEEAQSRGHAVWEGAPCKGALYPISRLQTGSEGFLCMNVVHLSPRYPAIGDLESKGKWLRSLQSDRPV